MNTIKRLNSFIEKRMYIVVITGIISGLLFPNLLFSAKPAVPWVFGVMTFSLSLGTGFRDLKRVISSPLPLALLILCLHGISPLFAFFLGRVSFGAESLLTVGLVLAAAVPVGVSSVIWAGIADGDLPLSLTAVTLDSLASPLTVPLVVSVYLGKIFSFNAADMIAGLLQMIVFPTLLGVLIHDFSGRRIEQKKLWFLGFISKLGLAFVVGVNVSASRQYIFSEAGNLLPLFFILVTLVAFNFTMGYGFSRFMGFSRSIIRTFTFSVGIRNISAGIVIALNYFPPEAALPVVVALLIQQPTAGVVQHFLVAREP